MNPLYILIISVVLLFCGCSNNYLFSTFRDKQIVIDGRYEDWGVSTTYYDEKTKVVLNLINDADYLYISLISRNRAIEKQIMESGLILWFDSQGKQGKSFGIHFPIGVKEMGISLDENGKVELDRHLERLEGLQERIEIVNGTIKPRKIRNNEDIGPPRKGASQRGFSLEEARKFGIEARVGRDNDYFVYELKIPISKSPQYPFAIGTKSGMLFGLGIELREILGTSGRAMGAPIPPAGDMPNKGMFVSDKRLQLWVRVILARE